NRAPIKTRVDGVQLGIAVTTGLPFSLDQTPEGFCEIGLADKAADGGWPTARQKNRGIFRVAGDLWGMQGEDVMQHGITGIAVAREFKGRGHGFFERQTPEGAQPLDMRRGRWWPPLTTAAR